MRIGAYNDVDHFLQFILFQYHMASGSDEPPERDVKCEACGQRGRTNNWLWDHLKGPDCPCLALLGYGNDLKGYQKEYKNKARRLLYKEHRDEETARKRREVSKISLGLKQQNDPILPI